MAKRSYPICAATVVFVPVGHRPGMPEGPFHYRGPDELEKQILAIAKHRWGAGGEPVSVSMTDNKIVVGQTNVAHFEVTESTLKPSNVGAWR